MRLGPFCTATSRWDFLSILLELSMLLQPQNKKYVGDDDGDDDDDNNNNNVDDVDDDDDDDARFVSIPVLKQNQSRYTS